MKVALITGIRRIGFHIAKHLLERGYDLAVVYNRSEDKAKELLELSQSVDKRVVCIKADLSKPEDHLYVVSEFQENFDRLDAFVHVASPYYATPLESLERKDLYAHFVPTAEAFLMLSKHLCKIMLKNQGQPKGRVVAFGDWATNRAPYRNYSAYFVSKGALHTSVKVLAKELAPHLLVNAIALGPTLKADDMTQEQWIDYIKRTPLKREVSLKDVLNLTEFLLNVESMTGEIINLDSGKHLSNDCS